MKKLQVNIKSNLLFVIFFLINSAFAAPVATIVSIEGTAFVQSQEGTHFLSNGYQITDFSEIITEVGSTVVVNDFNDHQYIISGGSQIKFFNKVVELRRGYLWVKSFNSIDDAFEVHTANAFAKFSHGQFIISFDPVSSKTQLLVTNGEVRLSNILRSNLTTLVRESEFSFVNKDYNDGLPRHPTTIGKDSFFKVTSLFGSWGTRELATSSERVGVMNKVDIGRKIASLPKKAGNKKDILVIKSGADKNVDIEEYYGKFLKSALPTKKSGKKVKLRKKSKVKLRVFGKDVIQQEKKRKNVKSAPQTRSKRAPASLNMPTEDSIKMMQKNEFEKSLINAYKDQKRHNSEVNSLIKDLKAYSQDYKDSY